MFELVDVSRMDSAAALDVVESAERAGRLVAAQRAVAILQVVRTYRHEVVTDKVRLGAAGTPLVDDFACLELAAALRRDPSAVTAEVAELLTLQARHPQLWQYVLDGDFAIWQARRVAQLAWELPLEAALWLDATLAPFATRLGVQRLLRFAESLVAEADPAAANARFEAARRGRRVEIGQSVDGVSALYGQVDTADAIYLDAALAQLSDILAANGSQEPVSVRRAEALGILATPARALALIQGAVQPTLELGRSADERGADPCGGESGTLAGRGPQGCAGHSCGAITVNPDQLLPKATLVVHVSEPMLDTGRGLARAEKVGAVSLEQLQVLLHNKRITIRPVLDTAGVSPVDSYEIPARIRRAVLVRQPWEVFPYSSRASRTLDLDHTRPYRWDGTPGQTAVGNLGPLARKVHRAKTHAGWQLQQSPPGTFTWATPLGRRYVVAASGLTYRVGRQFGPVSPGPSPDTLLLPAPPGRHRRPAARLVTRQRQAVPAGRSPGVRRC